MVKGCLVVFEGIDGSGKTEQFRRLTKNLKDEKFKVVETQEPTKTLPIGRLIRTVLYENTKVSEESLALLFAADRADHTINKIKPALREGAIVISDRYVYSSYAYQSKGMDIEIDLDWLAQINRYAIHPDIVIYLDISAEVGQQRLNNGQKRVSDHTYFENIIKQEKIRSIYYKIFKLDRILTDLFNNNEIEKTRRKQFNIVKLNQTTVIKIDGNLSKNKIEKIIYDFVINHLKKCKVARGKAELFTTYNWNSSRYNL